MWYVALNNNARDTLTRAVQGYVFPKATPTDKLPSIGFDVGGKTYKINKEDLAYSTVGADMYYGGIQSCGSNPFSILGDVFLRSVYCVFDVVSQ